MPEPEEPETQIFVTGKKPSESHLLNPSWRSLIAMVLVITVCAMSLKSIKVEEPLYSLSIAAVAYYFGQREKPKTQV